MQTHKPIMVEEVLTGLNIKPNGFYVDATFGRGGHSKAILERLSNEGKLLVIDKDPEAIKVAKELQSQDSRIHYYHGSFKNIDEIIAELDLAKKIDGILLDLGVSSPQLDNGERGFSFLRDGPLDMRMNPTTGVSAKDWLNSVEYNDLIFVIKTLGEENFAKPITRAIIKARDEAPIETTNQLAEIIKSAVKVPPKNKHPATKTFQAIRIYINEELEDLKQVLGKILGALTIGGRMAIISFHSLEDRIVKQFIQKEAKGDDYPRDLPIKPDMLNPTLKKIGKAIRAKINEVDDNVRARSAVLRIAEKLADKKGGVECQAM